MCTLVDNPGCCTSGSLGCGGRLADNTSVSHLTRQPCIRTYDDGQLTTSRQSPWLDITLA